MANARGRFHLVGVTVRPRAHLIGALLAQVSVVINALRGDCLGHDAERSRDRRHRQGQQCQWQKSLDGARHCGPSLLNGLAAIIVPRGGHYGPRRPACR